MRIDEKSRRVALGRKCCLGRWGPGLFLALMTMTAQAQTVSLSPTTLNFGNVVFGSTSAIKKVTLTNTGSVALSITSIVSSANFVETNNCRSSVSARAKCTISVAFSPTAAGAYSGTITIIDDASNSPQTIALSGTGVNAVILSVSKLTFASRTVGTTSSPLLVTLANNLTTALTITSVSVVGDFAQTNTCGSLVPAGTKCTISTTFTPTLVGSRTGILTVTDNGNNSPQTVSLAGTGSTAGLLSIAVTPLNPSVGTGAAQQFYATGTFSGGTTYDLTQYVRWSSMSATVATISNVAGTQGLATASAAGTTTIKAVSGKISGSTLLSVSPSLVSITVTPAASSIALGTGQQFTATGNYSDGSAQNLTNTVIWNSSATNVGTINGTGLATSVATGTTTINATSGSVTGSTTLTVNPAVLLSIAVTPANASAALGTTEQYMAVGTYSDGSTLDLTTTATWSSSATAVATISNIMGTVGLANPAAVGTTNITASLGSVSGSTGLTVTPAILTTIVVTPALPSIPLGTTQQFTATGTFADGSTQNLTGTVTWSSSGTDIATIGGATGTQGLATSVAVGTTTIAATSGKVTADTSLTVSAAALVSIAVTPANQTIASGTTLQFQATGTFTDGSTRDMTSTVTWSSDTVSTATVNNAGLAQSVGVGSANITATSGTVSHSTTLTVSGAALVSIAVNPPAASIPAGATQQFTATATFSDSSTQDVTSTAYWSSSNGTVATISDSVGSQGLSTGLGAGSITITAASGSVNGTAGLTVTAATLVSISVAPQNPSIALGASQQFTATGTYTDSSTQDLTTVATWNSSSSSVAIISTAMGSYGLATSSGQGMATISATSNSISSSTTITVLSPALVSITITPDSAAITVGTTQQFVATGTYTNGSTQDLTGAVSWDSSSGAVATIAEGGLSTGRGAGTVTITATSGVITASAELSVGQAALVSLAVTPVLPSIVLGTTQQFTATGTYSDGSTQDLTSSATWTSSAPAVATISSGGLATSRSLGTSKITVTAISASISGSVILTVTPATLVSVALTPSIISLNMGYTQQFTATGTYTDGSTQNLTNSVAWASDGASATVTSTGLATAAQLGSAHVIATSGSISSSAILISILTGSITALPPGLYFPPTPSGTISTIPQTATIYNLGSTNATITGVALTGSSSFQLISGTYPVMLAPGAYASFTFSFSPGTTGSITGTATFSYDTAAPQTVTLNGTGTSTTAVSSLSATSLAFGNQPLGTISPSQTVTITDTGTSSFTIETVTTTNPFLQAGFSNPVKLTAGSSFSFQVNYAPYLTGAITGTILVTYDALPNQSISLTGTATAPTSLGISTFPTLPTATQGAVYQATLTSVGGIGQTTWKLASGSILPSGLSLSSSGLITGTLASSVATGKQSFTLQVTDSNNPPASASLLLNMQVSAPTGANCNNISRNATGTTSPLVAINDLGTGFYGQYQGGLYANGSNVDDPTHHSYGVSLAQTVQPLDSNGNPNPNGKYVLLTIGHSNTQDVSGELVTLATSEPTKNPNLVFVNGATGSSSADELQDPSSYFWSLMTNNYLPNAGVSPQQVEIVWLNDVDVSHPPSIPALRAMLETIARNLLSKFPNTKMLYLSSVNYTAYSNGLKNSQPEPPAYEAGLSMKAVIQDQINGVGNINYNPANGPVVAPWASWAAYYWTNGLLGRSDGLTWSCQDNIGDGVHPATSGRVKAAAQLLNFMKTDDTAIPWY